MSLFLAIDQSTSATKALLVDAAGKTVDREAREHRQHYPQPGWVEHDAEEIWQNTLAACRALLDRHAARRGEIASLSITNQRETVVVFDRATGRPLCPAIVWQCRRGDTYCAQHRADGDEPLVRRKTGLKLDPYFSASKLQWLVQRQPGLSSQLKEGSALVGTIDTYLIYRLTGGKVFATDSTNASRTLLFDINRLAWDDELCALWEVPRRALPEVRESAAQFGETTLAGLLPAAVPIRGVMGDSQASLFAQRCFAPGDTKVTLGTGSSILLNVGNQPRLSDNGVLTALGWVRNGSPTYAFEGIIISSASTLNWLRDQLGIARDIAELESLARSVPDSGGVHVVPAFNGLGLPHWRPSARAAITGLSNHSDRRHVARAGFESIAFQICDALAVLRKEAELPMASLRADGGPSGNAFLMQLLADLTQAEVHVPPAQDGSAMGAVLAGQIGLGLHANAPARPPSAEEAIYQPTLPAARIQAMQSGWQAAVRQVLAS